MGSVLSTSKNVFYVAMLIALFFVIAPPKPAHAGFFSFIEDILNPSAEASEETPSNTQKMALLEPIYNAETNGVSIIDLNIANKNTLVADSGPMGTIADITEAKSDQISVYVVRKGDTLSKIAEMFEVSENTIRWTNDIKKGESISVGQKLVILPISGVQYTVKKGDTIKSVAKKFNGDVDEIISFNNLPDDGELTVGEDIIIPDGDVTESDSSTKPANKKTPAKKKYESYPSYDGYFAYPLDGGRKSQGIHGKNAVDLAISCGEPIYAAASGDVILSRSGSYNGGYGNYVVVSHPNGTQTLYAHMSETVAKAGWSVSKGQLIGYIGHTGHTIPNGPRGCHLHLEVRGAKNPF